MGCGCKQPVVRNPKPQLTVEEIEKNHTIQPITLTEEQITEYLNHKNGERETISAATDDE
jgi:hypothetical protein